MAYYYKCKNDDWIAQYKEDSKSWEQKRAELVNAIKMSLG
jgi:hypothetical protein